MGCCQLQPVGLSGAGSFLSAEEEAGLQRLASRYEPWTLTLNLNLNGIKSRAATGSKTLTLISNNVCFPGVWCKFVCLGCVCVGGWLVNFVPFLLMEKTLFLYHYLPALCYLYLLSPALLEHMHTHLLRYISSHTPVINCEWLSKIHPAGQNWPTRRFSTAPINFKSRKSTNILSSWCFVKWHFKR